MSKRKKILSGVFALVIGLSVAVPMRASADDYNYRAHHHNAWRWNHYQDHDRAYPAPAYAYGQRGYGQRGYIPANGQGRIDPNNPNLYWACDSDGHHCHWAPRY
jgi:hypothetical protein